MPTLRKDEAGPELEVTHKRSLRQCLHAQLQCRPSEDEFDMTKWNGLAGPTHIRGHARFEIDTPLPNTDGTLSRTLS
jgi:hypothetical protein